jgi:hypothetical protein
MLLDGSWPSCRDALKAAAAAIAERDFKRELRHKTNPVSMDAAIVTSCGRRTT